jgi:hypothetical protein
MRCIFRQPRGLMLLFALIAASCQKLSVNDLPGTYRIKYSFGDETLIMQPNGEYTQLITVNGDPVQISTQGTWVYSRRDGEITLRNHIMAHDGYCGLNPKLRDPKNLWNAVLSVTKDFSNRVVMTASADGSGCNYQQAK